MCQAKQAKHLILNSPSHNNTTNLSSKRRKTRTAMRLSHGFAVVFVLLQPATPFAVDHKNSAWQTWLTACFTSQAALASTTEGRENFHPRPAKGAATTLASTAASSSMTTNSENHDGGESDDFGEEGIKNHHHCPPEEETPALISSSLAVLEEELNKIAPDEREFWDEARRRCPDLTDDSHRLMFLRSERYDAGGAARKLVRYWAKRAEIFPDGRAFRPLTFGGGGALSDEEDGVALSRGVWRIAGKDDRGRSIVFADPSRHERNRYSLLSMTRANWYVIHAALEDDEENQREGLIFISYPKNVRLAQFDPKLARMSLGSEYLPIHVAGFHVCHPPRVFSIIFPVIKGFLGKENSKKIILHSGSEAEVINELSSHGISRGSIPTDMGGDFEIDHDSWIEKRRRAI